MPDPNNHPESPSDKPYPCLEMLQLIIDGGATPEQHANFRSHMEACMPCYQTYELEVALKTLLKSKCGGNGAPPDLVEKIKTQISQNLPH